MTHPISIHDMDATRLDRLQGEMAARIGRDVNDEDLVSALLTLGEREPERLAALFPPAQAGSDAHLARLPTAPGSDARDVDVSLDLLEPRH